MFPTTVWTQISAAGDRDEQALDGFARRYRPAVLAFVERRGFRGAEAEDLCQDVFVRVLRGDVLSKADRGRGRFRSLLLAVTTRVIQDHLRKRREFVSSDVEPPDRDPDFDHDWAVHLTERAMDRLREQGSPYFDVLRDHIAGQPQARNRLWHARNRLAALVREEIAETCASREDFEDELRYLARYLGDRARED